MDHGSRRMCPQVDSPPLLRCRMGHASFSAGLRSSNKMNAGEKLKKVFGATFELPGDTNFEALQYRSIAQWDSVAHMQLVAALETEFDIMMETEDVIGLSSFPKAREILQKYNVSFAD